MQIQNNNFMSDVKVDDEPQNDPSYQSFLRESGQDPQSSHKNSISDNNKDINPSQKISKQHTVEIEFINERVKHKEFQDYSSNY